MSQEVKDELFEKMIGILRSVLASETVNLTLPDSVIAARLKNSLKQ